MSDDEHLKSAAGSRHTHVAVCICTYQRPDGLDRLLTGLSAQIFENVATPMISIIITDNECNEANRAVCDRFVQYCKYSLLYLQEARRGISYARNTCLDNLPSDCDFVAMIDDDEVPEPGWLNHLLYAQQSTSADIIAGPTLPVFEPGTPAWIIDTGYFAKPHDPHLYRNLEPFPPTATCNVLMRADIFSLNKLRFDPELALSGSEDKLLFQDLKQRGLSFVWASNAKAHESIPAKRAQLGYMLSEALRRGSTRLYVKTKLKAVSRGQHYRLAFRSVIRSVYGMVRYGGSACLYLLRGKSARYKAALCLLNATENLGFLGGVIGYRKNHY